MKKRLLVTGYGGFVAGSVVWQAGQEWDVFTLSRSTSPAMRNGVCNKQFDLCDREKLSAYFEDVKPDSVIHTAALADIDYCQKHQEEAEQVNAGVTEELARLCAKNGAKIVFCSTDTVFDGVKGFYTEEDAPNPLNYYAETKVRSEEIIRDSVANSVVARLSLVMGLPVLGTGNSFLAKMIATLDAGKEVYLPKNEIRTPIDVISLGQALLELAANDFTGMLHLAGNTRLNRYEMGCYIAEKLGYSIALIKATDSNAMEGRAPRPNDASLDNTKARNILKTPMKTLLEGLDKVFRAKENQNNE
jgi:dTDP-4-dehydrorhamnose reductase